MIRESDLALMRNMLEFWASPLWSFKVALIVRRRFLALFLCLGMLAAGLRVEAQSAYRLNRPDGGSNSFGEFSGTSVRVNAPPPVTQPRSVGLAEGFVSTFSAAPEFAPPVKRKVEPPRREVPVDDNPFRGSAGTTVFSIPTIPELTRLSQRDVVIVIDKSGSMSEADCPGDVPSMLTKFIFASAGFGMGGGGMSGITRWEWCRRQTMHVAQQMARVPGNHLKLVLFDNQTTEFDNVSINAVSDIFNRYRPGGGTNATKALKLVINEYLQRRNSGGHTKPLSILCITDGAPSSPRSLKDLIVDTTMKLNSPNEIAISFLQIGHDPEGNKLLPDLDYGLGGYGARFDIVKCQSFNTLTRTGLMRAILDTIRAGADR